MRIIIIILLICLFFRINSQTTNISGVINNYASVNTIGSQSVSLSSATGFSVGDRVLLIQMKGATIDVTNTSSFGTITSYNDAGNYELCDVASISSTTITFTSPLIRTYNSLGLVQLVKVPVYNNVNVTGVLTCLPWNGLTGGVLAFEATGIVTLNANIDVSGKGFLGGAKVFGQFISCAGNLVDFRLPTTSLLSGYKGEGITLSNSLYTKGLGALANGGGAGNDVNGGGAGGGNFGQGGHGGNSKCSSSPITLCGGLNGKNCSYSNTSNKIFLGGGGGSGHENDGVSTAGVSGGGIILMRCTNVIGNSNSIISNGTDNTFIAGNDGQGGGGAGGTVLIDACSSSSLTISVKGGFGGKDNFSGPDCHGKGGGGGGGIIWTSSSLIYNSILTGGLPGVFTNSSSQCFNASNGATAGLIGGTLTGLIIPGSIPLTSSANFTLTPTSSPVLCNGNSTGSASVSVTGTGPYTYSWSPGSYTTSTINNVGAGIYTVTVSAGACAIKTETVSITSPSVITTTTLNNTICAGSTAIITPTISGGTAPYSVLWLHNNATTFSVSVTPSVTTNYSLVVTDNNNCVSQSIQTISVNPLPILSIASNTSVCLGQSILLTANGASTYTWTNPVATTNIISVSPTSTTVYTVNGTSFLGCVGLPVTQTITVLSIPTLTLISTPTICAGQTATISVSGATTYSLIGGSAFTNSISITPTSSTNYTVIGSNGSCSTSATSSINVVVSPSISITSNTSICVGGSVTLTANGANTYTWTNPISNSNTVSVNPSSTTVYSVIGTSSLGCIGNTVTQTITVNPLPILSITSNTSMCIGQSILLTANGASSYTWTNPVATTNTISVSPASTTVYTVNGTSAFGCIGVPISQTISVLSTPILTVSTSPTICAGQSATLSVIGASNYTWSPTTNLNTSIGASVIATPPASVIYTVNGSNAIGCVGSNTLEVAVIANPNISVSASPLTICTGSTSTLTASGATAYTWSPSSSLSLINSSVTVASPINTTTYIVVGSNTLGTTLCTSFKTIPIVVLQKITPIVSPKDVICFGQHTTVYASGGNTYHWIPSNSVVKPNDSVTIVKPAVSTIYTVSVSYNNLCPVTGTVQVDVNPLPSVYAGKDTIINIDEEVVLHGTGNVTVGFLSPDGVPLNCNYCPIITVHPPETTCYVLEGENNFGCRNWDTVCVIIKKEWAVYIPNTFTPNGDLNNEYFIPKGYGIATIDLIVFDRWGSQIFKEDNTTLGWDGKYKGKICEQGVYVYQVKVVAMSGEEFFKTGHVTILGKAK